MTSPSRLCFDDFELRLDSGELLRSGTLVAALQPQPARVLELIASRSGEVVSREEIRQLVWGESFVDFDASLNFCVKQIRRALGDSATSPRYIETLPRRGYRFLRPVRAEAGTNGDGVAVPAVVPEPPPLLVRRKRVKWILPAGISVAVLLLLVLRIASLSPSPRSRPRLVVLPLACESATDPQICGGVTEALTAEITRRFPGNLQVIASTSPLVYQRTRKPPRQIGKELGASHLITGSVDTSGGRLRLTAHLSTTGGRDLWQDNFEAELMDAPRAYEQIARKLAATLDLPLPPADMRFKPSREASEAYLRGVYLRKQWRYEEAVKNLENAVLLAPSFAPAWAELARARAEIEHPSRVDASASQAAALRALNLGPRLPEAHLAMANVLFKQLIDRERAGTEYRQALVLDPGNAEILHDYGIYLAALGRFDEAITHVNRARELDPASMAISSDLSWVLYLARHYDEAVREARNTLSLLAMTRGVLPPQAGYGRSWSYHVLIYGSMKRGDEQTALETFKVRMREAGEGAATERIPSLKEFLDWRVQYVAKKVREASDPHSYDLATANSVAGRTEEALGDLEQQCRNGGEGIMFNFIAVEPVFDPLHGDPRFAGIVDCTGIPRDAPARRTLSANAD